MEVVVEIENLTKRFGALAAVDNVSFRVGQGEVLGFLGPNGAGKSTTMKMITGFLTPDAGKVTVAGLDLAERPVEVKRRIGYLPEGAPLYGDMTPRAFLGFIAHARGLGRVRSRGRLDTVVEQVHIGAVLDQPIETLSKGFKRRVGLAQAILHDPEVLILDEPTDGLDPNQKSEVRNLILGMSSEKVIVLSTHILEEVEAVCTRAIIISGGRLLEDNSPDALLAKSRHHNAVTVGLRTNASGEVRDALEGLPAVDAVEMLEETADTTRLRVLSRDREPLVVAVSELVRARGWEISELHVERGRLDDVFREITGGRLS